MNFSQIDFARLLTFFFDYFKNFSFLIKHNKIRLNEKQRSNHHQVIFQ